MSLQVYKQALEVENLIGMKYAQTLVRAEALVPGAGREAIEPLMAEAMLCIGNTDLQTDRIVVEGSICCQAVYRQGEETTLRALTTRASLNQALDIPGTTAGMMARVWGEVEHVDTKYENGHMVFLITCGVRAQVMRLSPAEVISTVGGLDGVQTVYKKLCSVKMAAEAGEQALLKETVALPAALDARTSLMDWATVDLEEVSPDLGGVRVKGRIMVETLVSSGVAGRPAVLVKYPLELDQLVEIPEWLAENVFADVCVQSLRTQVEQTQDEDDAVLSCEAEIKISVIANATDCADALTDIYATRGNALESTFQKLEMCVSAQRICVSETVRGTVLIGENAPGVGTVLAARVHPVIGEWRNENGRGVIEGILETNVLYIPGGSDMPAAAQSELPFSINVPIVLNEESAVDIRVSSAEGNALMSDRLEMKIQLKVCCEARRRETFEIVEQLEEGDAIQRKSGIIIFWPEIGEDAWQVGKRYAVASDEISDIQPGKPVIIKT